MLTNEGWLPKLVSFSLPGLWIEPYDIRSTLGLLSAELSVYSMKLL